MSNVYWDDEICSCWDVDFCNIEFLNKRDLWSELAVHFPQNFHKPCLVFLFFAAESALYFSTFNIKKLRDQISSSVAYEKRNYCKLSVQ